MWKNNKSKKIRKKNENSCPNSQRGTKAGGEFRLNQCTFYSILSFLKNCALITQQTLK